MQVMRRASLALYSVYGHFALKIIAMTMFDFLLYRRKRTHPIEPYLYRSYITENIHQFCCGFLCTSLIFEHFLIQLWVFKCLMISHDTRTASTVKHR